MAHKLVIYPVILHPEKTGYSVEIPDINNGAWTQGESMEEALEMASDLIGTMLVDEMTWPKPTALEDIQVTGTDIKTIVSLDMEDYRRRTSKTVRKNVSIPEYLVKMGKDQHINFSEVLTQALEDKLIN
ncbi:hypothetical protein FAM21834_01235 [Lentilactobacillus parabuchneri]|jgi:predicted RNase H-like HicB family nuclease|uniref:HicB family protein n=2 Tax=Lentilactobacillus parabuchneri TaxID=152331 RepID=A0A1X1FFF3_9LACO|nr:type II toxin-antitoxin system HicB family antitoxin [Lentilactobacillus parabuchneri]APR07368.1 hypothetical protein FAM21731_01176 [Lentilactobacillus parabuchneri]KRN78516.1 hypothetical protein IV42_GL002074 [Lentilactobacillus parabuchneri]MBW0223100.1 type II toxin-antitoxin system HicB family antitoxin [Lentilactobacillus parabuchneri]MBW0245408.1 type II toxin-antitoxin system HicB family antitoxin [Lentilactobacillus parabuchneri]MBW0263936.1 type II toxin-antitoxin system HicB fam